MKKITLLFFLFLFLSEIYYLNVNQTNLIKPVNGYIIDEKEGLTKYEILFDKTCLTTKYFQDYFPNTKIIFITLEIPELLKRKNISDTYYFDYSNNQKNLKRIANQYYATLKKYNFTKEYYLKQYEGIRIKKVVAEMTQEEVSKFQKSHENVSLEPFT